MISNAAKSAITAALMTPPTGAETRWTMLLPPHLSRELYVEVNDILKAAGGKWKKGKGHLFTRDPRVDLHRTMTTGEIASTKKDTQAFYTPEKLAADFVRWTSAEPGMSVLEPSAGEGALANELCRMGCDVVCVEIDPVSVAFLRDVCCHNVIEADFLKFKPGILFDAAVMNPPFTRGTDIKHVLHALTCVVRGGFVASIMSPSWKHGERKLPKLFRELMEAEGRSEDVPAGAFKESGTEIATVMVEITRTNHTDSVLDRAGLLK